MDSSVLLLLAVFAIFVLLAVTALALAVYSGLLHDIKVGTGKPPVGKFTVAYKFARGPYKDCGSLFTEACSLAPTLRCFGVYYDDPHEVPAEKLRYAVGSILSTGDDLPDPDLVRTFEKYSFKMFVFPAAVNAVSTSFPHTTTFSITIAVSRVYSAMFHYIQEKHLKVGPFLEIYHDSVIDYMAPLDHLRDFYVPEALAAEEQSLQPADEAPSVTGTTGAGHQE